MQAGEVCLASVHRCIYPSCIKLYLAGLMMRTVFSYSIVNSMLEAIGRTTMFQPNSTQKSVIPGIFHMERLNGLDVFEMPIAELQNHLAQQSFTSEEYVAFCLERIRRVRLKL